nr:coiled-coil domain-containing protein 185 [Dasypus novemcinctus]
MAGLGRFSPPPDLAPWERAAAPRERVASARRAEPGSRAEPGGWAEPGSRAEPGGWAEPGSRAEPGGWAEPGSRAEPALSAWARAPAAAWGAPRAWTPQESRSLTDVARRPPPRARKPRSRARRPEGAWGEAESQAPQRGARRPHVAWQSQAQRPPQPRPHCRDCPPAPGNPPPPNAWETCAPESGTLGREKVPSGDQWAAPVCRGLDQWSLTSVPTEKSSAPSKEFRTQPASVYSQNRDSSELLGSLASHSSPSSGSSEETQSQHSHIFRNQLAEAVISSRDQKIVDLVLARLRKAQRMRELQQQAVEAWEELKRSDRKVQMILERERWLLLQQSQVQWQLEQEQRRQPGQLKAGMQKESRWRRQWEEQENQGREKPERAQAQHPKQRQAQQPREQERTLRGPQEQASLQPQKSLEQACREAHLHTTAGGRKAQESSLTSLVNHQARKVLMECQAKAEELLRKLSQEQRMQQSPETPKCLLKERHRELRDRAPKAEVRWRAGESEEQRKAHKRLPMELADQETQQARGTVPKNLRDRVQHARDLSLLREKSQHVLKLKAEKEDKCHIEGIKEAVRKKEQRRNRLSRETEAALEECRKISRASLQARDRARALQARSL